MDPITPLHQDPLHEDTPETPHQEPQKTCTMNSPNSVDRPQPPTNHPIQILTSALQRAIQENDLLNLDSYINLYAHNLETNPYFGQYDCSKLHTTCQTAINIINSYLGGSHIPGQY